ncbi:D-alanine--D-alanine ligase [Flavicella sp.]|uniref:D-alanine--D-alanine ligase n=1 Tax=Flavicella sp. TaxID=2957742 RepID=UPI00260921AE|nr:D-alanine--D-alanine ligase [Flavicella sp.]MDG1803735.1 D-alanine--D-alanine ligase [Flavicella sp.]
MTKKNIAVIMGGFSSEHEISVKSGTVVYNHIDTDTYNPYKIHISEKKWVLIHSDDKEYEIDKNDFSATINNDKISFDFVFNVIHGTPGEDGKILAYFDMLNIPYSSAPFYQMALTFNKRDCLSVVKQYGIKTATSIYLNQGDSFSNENIVAKVGLPCFVKPNNAGSSFGISKVHDIEKLDTALEIAFKEDKEILIESFLDGTEVSVGVIQYKGKVKVLPITEIVSENDFFDYEAKYLGKSQEITPARITPVQEVKVTEAAKHIYNSLNMSGFSRSEFIFIGDEPYFLEMNTVPGMTEASLLPQQAEIAGISLMELITDTIERIK